MPRTVGKLRSQSDRNPPLAENLRNVMGNNMFKIGKYKHYKGKEYVVIGLAKHSETLQNLVVYRALYGNNDLWVRPLKMFTEEVEIDGIKIRRFKYVGK